MSTNALRVACPACRRGRPGRPPVKKGVRVDVTTVWRRSYTFLGNLRVMERVRATCADCLHSWWTKQPKTIEPKPDESNAKKKIRRARARRAVSSEMLWLSKPQADVSHLRLAATHAQRRAVYNGFECIHRAIGRVKNAARQSALRRGLLHVLSLRPSRPGVPRSVSHECGLFLTLVGEGNRDALHALASLGANA